MDGSALDRWRLGRRRATIDWQAVTGTRPGTRMLELPATSMRARVRGEGGHGIVFLCDPPNLVEHYDEVFAAFGDDVGLACLEQPGFGFSLPKSGYDFSLEAHATALAGALEQLPFASRTLAAPCVSSFSAMRVARERPDLVDRLVLMQATDWATQWAWILRTAEKFTRLAVGIPKIGGWMVRIPFLAQAITAVTEPTFGERTYRSVIYRAPEREALVERLTAESNTAFARGACNCMADLVQVYFQAGEDAFRDAEQPTLVLWGHSDPSHASSPRDGLCRYVPHATVELIENTGHHLELENPAAVARHIRSFLRENAGDSAGQGRRGEGSG